MRLCLVVVNTNPELMLVSPMIGPIHHPLSAAYKRPAFTRHLWVCTCLHCCGQVPGKWRRRMGVIVVFRETMVNRLNVALQTVSDWGDANLAIQCYQISSVLVFHKTIHLSPTFRGISVPLTDSLQFLSAEISFNLTIGFFQYVDNSRRTRISQCKILTLILIFLFRCLLYWFI